MKKTAPICFAGSQLGESRHVCAFFHDDEEAYRVLLPFMAEGFACNHRAVHMVNAGQEASHRRRLIEAGIDLSGAEESGQFELQLNTRTYLHNGVFDPDRMLDVFESLASHSLRGQFPLSRIFCQMEWAVDGTSCVDQLIEFESRVDAVWQRHDHAVICSYNLGKFSAGAVIEIMRTHPMVIVGGMLQQNPFYLPSHQFLPGFRERRASRADHQVALPGAELAVTQAQLRQEIDSRRRAEQALSKASIELVSAASSSNLGVMTASIAHEVNQPLSGILTNTGTCLRLLSEQPPNIDGARETARRALRDGKRASEVITRLKSLYTRKLLRSELIDLSDIAQEAVSLALPELQQNSVSVRPELADDLPRVKGDRIQLQQVMLNLLRNASDAMRAVEERPRELIIRTEAGSPETVWMSVSDAGVGFTPETAEKLFEPFYTTKGDGMGIGLTVSRSIIEAHQGRLWATPNDGPGATFILSLPNWRPPAVRPYDHKA